MMDEFALRRLARLQHGASTSPSLCLRMWMRRKREERRGRARSMKEEEGTGGRERDGDEKGGDGRLFVCTCLSHL